MTGVQIQDSTGSGYFAKVNASNELLVNISSPVTTAEPKDDGLAISRVSVGATGSTLIAATDTDRLELTMQNIGPNPVYIGTSSVTGSPQLGLTLNKFDTAVDKCSTAAWWGVASGGTSDVITQVCGSSAAGGGG